MREFHKELRALKLHGAPSGQLFRSSPQELFSKIGAEVNEVHSEVLARGRGEAGEVAEELERTPEAEEILRNLAQMKASAPGPDGITVSMLRYGGPIV